MNKKRLFAFGCSFTHYAWPSYADFLGYEFDSFSNWAHPGLGNRAIAQRVAECNIKNNFVSILSTKLNVGLVTRPSNPKPLIRPLVKVVFPDPKSPDK